MLVADVDSYESRKGKIFPIDDAFTNESAKKLVINRVVPIFCLNASIAVDLGYEQHNWTYHAMFIQNSAVKYQKSEKKVVFELRY